MPITPHKLIINPVALSDSEVVAMSLVTISLVGNLVRPPEQMCFASGRTKTILLVAVNGAGRGPKAADQADFYRVEAWGKLAELAGRYLAKGNQIGASGRLVLDRWTDKQGRTRITPIVEATQLAFPPKLKVVSSDAQAAEQAVGVNPIGGEVVLDDETDEDTEGTADDTAYGHPPDAGRETVPPMRIAPQTA
jgi:single-strand DNA-binding protein